MLGDEWFASPPYGGASHDWHAKFSAHCVCRRVAFSVCADPTNVKISDCVSCSQLHGAPMLWAAAFEKHHVRFGCESKPFLRFYNAETDAVHEGRDRVLPCKISCSHCGTLVADEGRNMFMAFPTLFTFMRSGEGVPQQFQPTCRIFSGSASLARYDDLPRFVDDVHTPLSAGDFLRHAAPSLDGRSHKGQATGRPPLCPCTSHTRVHTTLVVGWRLE
jgi:hypothetical protein